MHQSTLSAESQGKLGAPKQGGLSYYLWSFTWGLGWVPALAALAGRAAACGARERRLGWLLVPAPLLFLAFMGLQGRYFGRWLLPIFPILCLLAACFAAREAIGALRARGTRRTADDAAPSPRRPTGLPGAEAAPAGGRRTGVLVLAVATVLVVALLAPGPRLQRPLGPRALARRTRAP